MSIRNKVKPSKFAFAQKLRSNPTPAEKHLWHSIRKNQLGFKFRRQSIILGFIVDFYCPRKRLIIEVDGSSHEGREAYDAHRNKVLKNNNFFVLRFSNRQVFLNHRTCLSVIRNILLDNSD